MLKTIEEHAVTIPGEPSKTPLLLCPSLPYLAQEGFTKLLVSLLTFHKTHHTTDSNCFQRKPHSPIDCCPSLPLPQPRPELVISTTAKPVFVFMRCPSYKQPTCHGVLLLQCWLLLPFGQGNTQHSPRSWRLIKGARGQK